MRFWFRFFSFLLSLAAVFFLFSLFFLLNTVIPHWIELGQLALEYRTQTHLHFEDVEIDLIRRCVVFKNVLFKGKDKEARVASVRLDFVIPDLQIHSFVIRRLLLEKPEFWVTRVDKKLGLFPDFFRYRPSSATWKWRIQLLVLDHPRIHFHDEIFGDEGTLTVISDELRICQDFDTSTTNLKGQLHFPDYPDAELAFDFKGDLSSPGHNHDLLIQAIQLDLPFLSAYQYPFSKIHLTHGTARIYADIHCRMGILDGYSHVKLRRLEVSGFNGGIFSTALGLSFASFVTMLKENHDELELDFYVKGTQDKPELKLGETTRHFILTAPIEVTKGSLNLVENILNTALLGLPRKLIGIVNPSEEQKEERAKEREKKKAAEAEKASKAAALEIPENPELAPGQPENKNQENKEKALKE